MLVREYVNCKSGTLPVTSPLEGTIWNRGTIISTRGLPYLSTRSNSMALAPPRSAAIAPRARKCAETRIITGGSCLLRDGVDAIGVDAIVEHDELRN